MRSILPALCTLTLLPLTAATGTPENPRCRLSTDAATGRVALLDERSGVKWDLGPAQDAVPLPDGTGVAIARTATGNDPIRLLDGALAIAPGEQGCALVPAREGLLIPADGPVEFKRGFPTSGYEGCHMNVMGFVKRGGALLLTWDGAYVTPELAKTRDALRCTVSARRPPHRQEARFEITLTPLGRGDWNTIAAAYRERAAARGLAITTATKQRRNPELSKLAGASNAKLWTCLARKRDEASARDESVEVKWTFDEAARVAEHLRRDLDVDRCLFMLGGWTEGGYDCRHPDALPANPECGGNDALAAALARIRALGYVTCLHDNYQDMYRDAKSWDPALLQKRPDGSPMRGGRWLGGRAWLVCAPKTLELARRPQNLPEIARLLAPQAYFIDTTFAVDPQECFDKEHPLTRDDDIRWKQALSDYARQTIGLFGSECGREWAIPHSDFFEGLSGVSGKYFHNLDPNTLGATVVPLFEMVYHDCQFVYGKYGYAPENAAEYVAHHALCARTLNYHRFDTHLYWLRDAPPAPSPATPSAPGDRACFARADGGWAERLGAMDRFVKNTHEILGPLAAATAHARLVKLEFLSPDRSVRRATFAEADRTAATVTVNFGATPFDARPAHGDTVTLPQWGFLIESPRFVAFHASTWAGRTYAQPALFTARIEGARTKIFHGFGDPNLRWQGHDLEIPREMEFATPPHTIPAAPR